MKLEDLIADPELILNDDADFQRIIDEIPKFINPLINSKCSLDEIYTDGLDATQIWPQVQMVLDSIEYDLNIAIGKLQVTGGETSEEDDEDEEEGISADEENAFGDQLEQDSEAEKEGEEEVDDDEELNSEDQEDLEENDQEEEEDHEVDQDSEDDYENKDFDLKPKKDKFGLNDDFFDLEAYQKQVLALEDKDTLDEDPEDDGEEIDLFADMEDDDDEDDEMYTYGDFFKQQIDSNAESKTDQSNKAPKNKKKKAKDFNEGDFNDAYETAMADMIGSDEEDEQDEQDEEEEPVQLTENLSTFEKQQLALQKEIAQLEKESIAEKKWTMKGEVNAKQRGAESALVEDLEFDRNAKPVPVITQEITETLEDIIRRRIRNDQFDDIPKRIISDITNFKPSQRVDVDERQSKKSLAQIYEDEYNNNADNTSKVSDELKAAHDEITVLWDKVNWELDSLYSANFIPKPKQKLLDVKVQTSTVSLEDAQPLTMGDTQRLAPQEIYKTNTKVGKDEVQLRSGVVMAKAELDREDKARLRRAKKRKQHNQDKDESIKKKKISTEQL